MRKLKGFYLRTFFQWRDRVRMLEIELGEEIYCC